MATVTSGKRSTVILPRQERKGRELRLTSRNGGDRLFANCWIGIIILIPLLVSSQSFGQNSTCAGQASTKNENQRHLSRMRMQNSPAVTLALTHIDAWSHHDWDKTRELLAPNVHASVNGSEFSGIDNYMALKRKGAQLVEPGSVQVISAIGDESNALILVTFRIGLGPGGTMVTMARSCRYWLDDNKRIKEERDEFFILSQ